MTKHKDRETPDDLVTRDSEISVGQTTTDAGESVSASVPWVPRVLPGGRSEKSPGVSAQDRSSAEAEDLSCAERVQGSTRVERMENDPPEEPRMGRTWTLDKPKELQRVLKGMAGRLHPNWFSIATREDVAQEVFCRLLKLGEFPDGSKREFCSDFLFQTTRNVVREFARKEGRRAPPKVAPSGDEDKDNSGPGPMVQGPTAARVARSDDSKPEPIDPGPSPFHVTRDHETGEAIRDCLSELIPERRRALSLHLLGWRIPEIANELGWSVRSAEGRVYRGMDQLRSCLKQKGVTL